MAQSVPILSPQMEANVNAILNQEPNIRQFLNGISPSCTITERPEHTCYYVDIVFHNQVKDGLKYTNPLTKEKAEYFEFSPYKVSKFKLQQEFVNNYINHYEVNVSLTVDQYELLYYNYKDLKCDLKLYAADADTGTVYGKDPWTKTFSKTEPILAIENAFCLFKDRQDILKKIPKQSVTPKNDFAKNANHQEQFLDNVLFQIVPNEDYIFRTARCNAIFNECTVGDAIWAIAKSTDCVEAIMMVEPDNKTVYKNLVIPPILDIPQTLSFLQSHYGIYNKGLNYYYQLGVLFVYPAFETKPVLPKDKAEACGSSYTKTKYSTVSGTVTLDELGDGGMCHIYMAGNGSATGMQYYHGYEGATIHIVSNSKSVFKTMADEGIENNGYGYIVQHADRVVDSWRVILEATDQAGSRFGVWPINIQETPNTEYLVENEQNAKIGVTSTKSNLKFLYDKSNRFVVQSKLHQYRRSLSIFEWNMAVPFTFRPGYRICYHFDGEDEKARDLSDATGDSLFYCTKDGTIEEVTYEFDITKRSDTRVIHACKATITASLELETTYHKEGI